MFRQHRLKKWVQPMLLPALVFMAVALVLLFVTRELTGLQDEVRHTQDVKDQLMTVSQILQEGESALRRFMLTADIEIRRPYIEGRDKIEPIMDD